MLFYRVEGLLANPNTEVSNDRRASQAQKREICMRTAQYSRKHRRNEFLFVAWLFEDLATVGIITDNPDGLEAKLQSYLKYIRLPLQDVEITEVTLGEIKTLLSRACHNDTVSDDDEILEMFGIDRLFDRRLHYDDNILQECSRKQITETVQRHLFDESFLPELERIYAGTSAGKIFGHPVHYMLQTDDLDTRREMFRCLLQALYANKRLVSKRYSFVDFRPGEDFNPIALDALYKLSEGGAVIIRYAAHDDVEDGAYATGEQDIIERICEVVKRYRGSVLTVICLPRECKQASASFYEQLGTMTFVALKEVFADDARARTALKFMAKQRHIRTDKALFAKLEPDKGYLITDLRQIFDEWYDAKLKRAYFPQYQALKIARQEVVKAAPKGSAYDDLQEMIGLSEAKSVIQKALNYYKMQKLYAERGIKQDHPAMHMVFTGNPGTAKTTVARLFAQIMKDNGLLSKGQLIEVGRSDLVGKYVGWTAKIVQEKFRAAKGGVLFIDEAYSLVENHRGSFGDEAINTIVQEMENHREDVVVIFAGYPEEMEGFLQQNPGLRSRIAFHIPFSDYSSDELCQIATLMGKSKGVAFEPQAQEKLHSIFDSARQQRDFGNGRFVRNILEQAKMNQASRLLEYDFDAITTAQLQTIIADDITAPPMKAVEKRKMGFAG